MARWICEEPHYINVPGTEWEHKEQDPVTNRSVRKVYKVPMYLEKGAVVCDGEGCDMGDIIFEGPPTNNMSPLDDAAEAISAQYRRFWEEHPIDSLPTTGGYGQFKDPNAIPLHQSPVSIATRKTAVPVAGSLRRI